MTSMRHQSFSEPSAPESARHWVRILAQYREPVTWRSIFEIGVSFGPFLALWALAWWSLSFSYWLAFALSCLNGGFLVRMFIIQHDCGHGGYFKNRKVSDWVGRVLGVLTLTPYAVWQRSHALHHGAAGNLDQRGIGDIHTMTVTEYQQLSAWGRLMYRLYRNPVVLFGLGPVYLYLFQNRLPVGLMNSGSKYWYSAMGTNLTIAVALSIIAWFGGAAPILLIFFPSVFVAASAGMWMFYVQHQFEDTHWDKEEDWQLHDAALHGSSHYVLPAALQWITGNIGVHHVHHLYSRIPFYRLTEVLRDHQELAEAQRMTLLESFGCVRLNLWDENLRKLVSFSDVRRRPVTV
jgi:acyl-lipid omega-6 desaturase (Delta-12 desaturase)